MSKFCLYDKHIIISGGSSGIGKSIAEILIKKYNCSVVAIGRSADKFEKFKKELGDFQNNLSYRLFDVSVRKNWEDFSREISGVDMIINCAGILPKFEKYSSGAEDILKINYLAAVYSLETLSNKLNADGRIVNVGSSSSLCPFGGVAAYCASKAAIERFTECIAAEKGINASIIMPGTTKTDVFRHQTTSPIFSEFGMNPQKMAKKIINKIIKGRRRAIIGIDAHLMNFGYKFFPDITPRIITAILKKSGIEAFKNIT